MRIPEGWIHRLRIHPTSPVRCFSSQEVLMEVIASIEEGNEKSLGVTNDKLAWPSNDQ